MTEQTPVLHFVPRAELDSSANLQAFIELCRGSAVLNARAQFELHEWDIGHLKGRNKVNRVVFSTLEASSLSKSATGAEERLPQPFMDFAKAAIVYLHDVKPVKSQGPRIAALRCLEGALRKWSKGARPTAVDADVLDSAVELAYAQASESVAYRTAGQIEAIAKLMNDKGFIRLRQRWSHGRKKPSETGSRISPEALRARQEKLPSRAVLEALADIYCRAVEAPDVLVSSNTALMLCAPERVNEVVRLRRNCFVEGEGEFKGKLGIRWSGSKGFENTTKWLPTVMAPVAREAIGNLLEVSRPAHELARWYTKNPGSVYLHEGAKHLRGRSELSVEELGLLLWGDETAISQARYWAKETNGLPYSSAQRFFLFSDVERAILDMLPATFPHMPGAPDLRCEDAMAVMRVNETHVNKATYLCMFTTVDTGTVTKPLTSHPGPLSIFERFGRREADGSPIHLKSHALRHYLNMVGQMGGLSSAEIALFSGRKDQKQNRAYDHMSSGEVQAPVSAALKRGFTSELEPEKRKRRVVTREEFPGLAIRSGHATKYGFCEHDFASEPCPMCRDCLNCQEHECVKGDSEKEKNLRTLKAQTELYLRNAQKAMTEGEYGADIWVLHHTKTLARINELLGIFDDPSVPAGARVRLDVNNAPLITKDNVHPIKFIRRSRHKAVA